MARPTHQLSVKPERWSPVSGSTGRSLVGSTLRCPPSPVRSRLAVFGSEPYTCDPSHQCPFGFVYAGGRVEPAGAESGTDRGIFMVESDQSSPGASGISTPSSIGERLCTNQSCTMNWRSEEHTSEL